jgi:hypothetical protein
MPDKTQRYRKQPRMSDPEDFPQPELPPCPIAGCSDAAGAIIEG